MGIGPSLQGSHVRPRKVTIETAKAVSQYDLIGLVAGNTVRAEDETWASAVATPSAPTVADGAVAVGSPLTNAATDIKVSIQFPWGEGALSAPGTATPTAGAMLKVTLAALPAPGLWWNIYVETAAGSDVYKLWGISYTGAILMVDSYGLGRVPPTAKASGALEITQYNFAQKFLGLAHQRKDASAVRCYGSSEDNVLIAHTAGLFPADCASATFAYGDPVGAAKQSGNLLESQKVVGVADISLGIGYYVGKGGASLTNIEIEIVTKLAPSWRQPIGLAA